MSEQMKEQYALGKSPAGKRETERLTKVQAICMEELKKL
jgi:hypothetical protein